MAMHANPPSEERCLSIEKRLRTVFDAFPVISLGYLFGSLASGTPGPMSDVDVAVLLAPHNSARSTADALEDALHRALGTERVDLVVLNDAPPPLAYRVVRDGRCLFCRDPARRQVFEALTTTRYLDFQPFRRRLFAIARRQILEEG